MARIKYKEAVGLEVKRGRPSTSEKPSKSELRRLYVRESKSIRDIARILGCSKDMIYRALKDYGISRRSRIRRSRLEQYSLRFMREKIKKVGMGETADFLGVSRQFLRRHLRDRESRENS